MYPLTCFTPVSYTHLDVYKRQVSNTYKQSLQKYIHTEKLKEGIFFGLQIRNLMDEAYYESKEKNA